MAEIVPASFQSFASGWKTFSDKVCNKLTEKAAKFIEKYAGADLIIVTGPTGMGKSSFISCITGEDVYVTSTLSSGTRNTALVPAIIEGKRYLFLDMPGFDADDFDDWHIYTMLMTAMATIERYVRFRGVMYVDTLNNIRITNSARKILTWLRHFCGTEYMANVTIVTTMWDDLNERGIKDKLARYNTWCAGELYEPFIIHGAKTYHHGLIRNGNGWQVLHLEERNEERALYAKRMIHEHYHDPTTLSLQIYDEIADGRSIDTTSAGRTLRPRLATPQNSNPSFDSQGTNIHDNSNNTHENTSAAPPPRNSPPQPQSSTPEPGTHFQDVKPWIKLLITVARIFFEASSSSNKSSSAESEDEDFEEDGHSFTYDWAFSSSEDESDTSKTEMQEESSEWRCTVQ